MKKRYFLISAAIITLIAGILIIVFLDYSTPITIGAAAAMIIAWFIFRKHRQKITWKWPVVVIYILVALTGIFMILKLIFESGNPALAEKFYSAFDVTYHTSLIAGVVFAWFEYKRKRKEKREAENQRDSDEHSSDR